MFLIPSKRYIKENGTHRPLPKYEEHAPAVGFIRFQTLRSAEGLFVGRLELKC